MKPGTGFSISTKRPPKPPCWRDFVSTSLMAESEFTDISKVARSSNESFSSDGNLKVNKPKKVRARIHRTRSQFAIEECDLPDEMLTMTLAETKPDDIGLCRGSSLNEQILQEANNRKCQTWLRNIEASQPLEDVSCYDLSAQEREAVSLEIPDDTCNYDQQHSESCSYKLETSSSNDYRNKDNTTRSSCDNFKEEVSWTYSSRTVTNLKHTPSLSGHEIINTC
ncbi:hypothetical protein DPMN_010778 [Dreissena polymorpha]|uniref:Uncharacterized protein n=1 Tax=Dreissena polymorpha TaxID=45954 RepID=A0A9D4N2S9_DREPO|nr:hypothetical protein DPMN_010778 [Dreissena polymorpha]